VAYARDARALLRRHRADDSINRAIGKLIRADLVVVDDVGLLPVSADAAEALFRVIDAAYEKRSIAISSNVHPSDPGPHGRQPRPPPKINAAFAPPLGGMRLAR